MSLKRTLCGVSLFCFFTSLLLSQSLVEIAKKERERREKLKGQKIILVTNADLLTVRKTPAVSTASMMTGQEQTQRPTPPRPKAPPTESLTQKIGEADKMDFQDPRKDPEAKLKEAQETADLLIFKMKALWQEYHSKSDKNLKDRIQSQIYRTSQELMKAREDEEEARKELAKRRQKSDS